MVKEIGFGLGVSVIIILLLQGFNIFPIVFLGFLVFFLFKVLNKNVLKGLNTNNKKSSKKIPQIDIEKIGEE